MKTKSPSKRKLQRDKHLRTIVKNCFCRQSSDDERGCTVCAFARKMLGLRYYNRFGTYET
jgi:hypothetical protein